MTNTIYKNETAQKEIFGLYEEKLESLKIPYQEIDVQTSFGRTRIIKTGNEQGQKIVLFHGINAGAPLALESVKELSADYLLYAIDTIGQATKSDETLLNIKDDAYAIWADEVLDRLAISSANFVGISYGAYILQKLMTHRPEKIVKSILVVPSGLVNGAFLPSFTKLSIPLFRYMMTKRDQHLRSFLQSFVPEDDHFMFRLQKVLLQGVKIDFRRPLLLQKKDVDHFTKPVYMMVADNDIFFPGPAAVKRAKQLFRNLVDVHYLEQSKHIPHRDTFSEIQQVIRQWVG